MARKKKIEIDEVQDSAPVADATSGSATASATPVVPDPTPITPTPAVTPAVPVTPTPKATPAVTGKAYVDPIAGFADGSALANGQTVLVPEVVADAGAVPPVVGVPAVTVAGSEYQAQVTKVAQAEDPTDPTANDASETAAAYFDEQALDPYERANSGVVIP